jgi:CDGSH-type Zn-finger protein/uncharacterized Fe-S cluster protein YjdI
MKSKVLRYSGEKVSVNYDLPRCIHAAECVHGLPRVFDPNRKPWIEPDTADPDELLRVVIECPTGALHLERKDGGPDEPMPKLNKASMEADGPVYVHGRIEIVTAQGQLLLEDTRVALCRCGASENKPLCDGGHVKAEFRGSGTLQPGDEAPATGHTGKLKLTPLPNGPLLFEGPLQLASATGESVPLTKGALCRCGVSENKPYCDGSHGKAGFLAE